MNFWTPERHARWTTKSWQRKSGGCMNFWTPERRLQQLLDARGQTPRRSTCPASPPATLPASFSPPMAPAPSSRNSKGPCLPPGPQPAQRSRCPQSPGSRCSRCSSPSQRLLPRVCVLGLGFPPGITDRIYCVHQRAAEGRICESAARTPRQTRVRSLATNAQ